MHKLLVKSLSNITGNRVAIAVRTAVLVSILAVGVVGVVQTTQVDAVQTPTDYCAQYGTGTKAIACKDGLENINNCDGYADIFDQITADICIKAAKDLKSGLIQNTPVATPSPSTSATPSSPATPSPSPSAPVSVETQNEQNAYKGAILLACAPFQDNTAAAMWCLYGGLGQNGTEYKPKDDCTTKKEIGGDALNTTACIAGSTAGKAFQTSLGKGGVGNGQGSQTDTSGLLGGLVDLFGGGSKSSGSNSTPTDSQLMNLLSQNRSISSVIDALHVLGPNAGLDTSNKGDNTYGKYINGAGKQQDIKPLNPGAHPSKAPAILFVNGGAWHMNDMTGQAVTYGTPCKNGTVGGDATAECLGGIGLGNFGRPSGGGATERGFATFDLTYRLGSSGVYYMLEDVLRGIRHVMNNAGMYDIDPNNIIIWGDSAGGSLAVRAAATGSSGAKVAVGWSAPTNAYTILFASYKAFLLGLDHSTCIPTDLAGLANTTDAFLGGSGKVAEYGKGLSGNDFSSIGFMGGTPSDNPMDILGDLLTAGQYAMTGLSNGEAITGQLLYAYNNGDPNLTSISNSGLATGVFNIATKKLVECMDNFRQLSPAIYASPDTPPTFLAGFDADDIVIPQQAYDMRDKLRSMGIRSEVLMLQGDDGADYPAFGASTNHLGYDPRFVCPTLNFIDSIVRPEKGQVNCADGINPSQYVDQNVDGMAPEMPGLFKALDLLGGGGASSGAGGLDSVFGLGISL